MLFLTAVRLILILSPKQKVLAKTFTPFFWKTHQAVLRRPLRQPLRQPVVRVVPAPFEEAAVFWLRVQQHQDALKNFFLVDLRSHQEAPLQLGAQAVVYIPQLKHFYLRRSRLVKARKVLMLLLLWGHVSFPLLKWYSFFYSGVKNSKLIFGIRQKPCFKRGVEKAKTLPI